MPSYKAIWQCGPNSAVDDVKELPSDVQQELYRLSEEVLVDTVDPALSDDEQSIGNSPFLMRRAASRQAMRDLESLPDGHPSTPRTVGYWFVYRKLNASEVAEYGGQGFWVARVVDDLQLAWLLQRAQTS